MSNLYGGPISSDAAMSSAFPEEEILPCSTGAAAAQEPGREGARGKGEEKSYMFNISLPARKT